MMPVISEKKLADLLESKKWFRSGTPKQFIKLLEANAHGADVRDLATIIWACSDDIPHELILSSLKKLEQEELDAFVKNLVFTGCYYDEDILIDDPYICYETV